MELINGVNIPFFIAVIGVHPASRFFAFFFDIRGRTTANNPWFSRFIDSRRIPPLTELRITFI